ncbi:hypothetical protein H0H81_001739 [Sphagnurus paluster]|uniref:Uncharacterized protein n=1 Tax=Sphagnurus paluster TaxID=117069 RepID=A0A9P7K1M8_9AGAR|nr:hypothetical protein H0H81_001739 [Sphagnurus paluster]
MDNNKKGKRKASSPAESIRLAPSRPATPVYQAASRCDTPDQGYIDYQHAQEHLDDDSSLEPNTPQEEDANNTPENWIDKACTKLQQVAILSSPLPNLLQQLFNTILSVLTAKDPHTVELTFKYNSIGKQLIAEAMAPKPSYPAAPHPRKAHLPTTLVAPASTKWVVIPNNKSQLRDAAKRPFLHHIVCAINHKLQAWAGKSIGGVQVANLGDSHILAATWTVGCNLLITAAKTCKDCGLATPTYSTIVGNSLSTIPAFSNAGVTVIPYRPAACLQIKGLSTWDPTTNHPVELTSVFQMLNGLGIFEGVELIKNSPAPSDALSWARDPKTFNAKLHPCAVMVQFYNNDG